MHIRHGFDGIWTFWKSNRKPAPKMHSAQVRLFARMKRSVALAVVAIVAQTVTAVGAVVAQRRAAVATALKTAGVGDAMAVAAFHHRHTQHSLRIIRDGRADCASNTVCPKVPTTMHEIK